MDRGSVPVVARSVDGTDEVGGPPPSNIDLAAIRERVVDEAMTRPDGWRTSGHLAVAAGAYVALAVLVAAVDALPIRLLAWLGMAWILIGNGAAAHEAVHGHLYRSTRANRFVALAATTVILLPWGMYRAEHLVHHATTATAEDPQGRPVLFRCRLQLLVLPLGGPYVLADMHRLNVLTALGRPYRCVRTSEQLRDVRATAVATLFFVALVIGAAWRWPGVVLFVWGVPVLIAMLLLFPFLATAEHADGAPGEPLENSRTTRSNRLVGWVYWNANHHAAHHLVPAVTYRHVRSVTAMVEAAQSERWLVSGYLVYYGGLLRSLPTFPQRHRPAVEGPTEA